MLEIKHLCRKQNRKQIGNIGNTGWALNHPPFIAQVFYAFLHSFCVPSPVRLSNLSQPSRRMIRPTRVADC